MADTLTQPTVKTPVTTREQALYWIAAAREALYAAARERERAT